MTTPQPSAIPNPFEGRVFDEVLQVTMTDGRVLVGKYWTMARMHLLTVRAPDSVFGEAAERMDPEEVASVVVLKDKERVAEEKFERTRGERVPGREPVTREDFRFRLDVLARAVAQERDSWRRWQLETQFADCANRIELAKSKRAWVLAEAKWYLGHNHPPEMADLWRANVASPSLFQKPRDQDFDPDQAVRRKRVPYPAEVANDPLSVPNVFNKLKGSGCPAYISLAAEVPYEHALICINFHEVPGRAKVYLNGTRADGKTTWTISIDAGNSRQALQREGRIEKLPLYARILDVVRAGLVREKGPSR